MLLPDRAGLFSLSIPGTHDSGTKGFSWNAECQRFSISEQLSLGVRAFDLRPGVDGNNLIIYHSSATHGSETLGSIFDTYASFLSAHPGEFLIIFLKDEIGSSNWAEKMKQVLDAHADRLLELNPYLTVAQMRGKMLVLSRDSWGDSNYGAVRVNTWQDNTTFDMTYRGKFGDELPCRIQDIYNVASSDNLNKKKADIERLLGEAMTSTTGKFYINHTSGYTKENYIFNNHYVADCAEKCNELALNYLSSHQGPTGSMHIDGRKPGERPWNLYDYFPKDFLLVIDESHVSVPQIRGMYNGDRARKQTLVDYGFRLPSALDNRPMRFDEWEGMVNQVIFVSATPGDYELEKTSQKYVATSGREW